MVLLNGSPIEQKKEREGKREKGGRVKVYSRAVLELPLMEAALRSCVDIESLR